MVDIDKAKASALQKSLHFGRLVALSSVWLFAVTVTAVHLYCNLAELARPRYGVQYVVGLGVVVCLAAAVGVLARSRRGLLADHCLNRTAVLFIALLVVLKLLWCLAFDSVQHGDIGRYFNFGTLISSESWGDLERLRGERSYRTYARRAFFYPAPLMRLFGDSAYALELSNIALQMSTLMLLYWWMRKNRGNRESLVFTGVLAMYPDWWYSVTLASHDMCAMFLTSLIVASLSPPYKPMSSTCVFSLKRVTFAITAKAVLVGGLSAVLEFQRDFGVFVIGACLLGLTLLWLCNPGLCDTRLSYVAKMSLTLMASIGFCLGYVTITRCCGLLLPASVTHVGVESRFNLLRHVGAVAADGAGTFPELVAWTGYQTGMDERDDFDVLARKALFEKFESGQEYWWHLLRKQAVLAGCCRTMEWAFCGVVGDRTDTWDIPLWSTQRTICCGIYSLVCFIVLLRLLSCGVLSITWHEIIGSLLGLGFLVPVSFLTEVQPTYDQLLAIPASIFVARFLTRKNPLNMGLMGCVNGVWLLRSVVAGAFGWIVLSAGHALSGWACGESGFTFAKIIDVQSVHGGVNFDRSAIFVELAKPSGSKTELEGAFLRADVHFIAESRSFEDGIICFFVSPDSRRQQLYEQVTWGNCDSVWEFRVGENLIGSGKVADLSEPVFVKACLPRIGQSKFPCRFTVRSPSNRDCAPVTRGRESKSLNPRIALEFFY